MRKEITPEPRSWIRLLDDMIESKEYEFAEEFLTDVREYVDAKNKITNKQTAAILKIRRSVQ